MSGFVLSKFLPYQIAALSTRLSREFSAAYKMKFGISVPEWRVVAHLSQAEESLSVREICAQVHMDKSKVSRAIKKLEQKGFVEKEINGNDRRLVELQLSEKGWGMVKVLTPAAEEFEAHVLASLGDDAPTFRALLDTLLNQDEATG